MKIQILTAVAMGSLLLSGCNVFTDLEGLRSEGPVTECDIENPCEGCTERNACGGCGTLAGAPGDACGSCDSGTLACDAEALTCEGDAGDAALNECGGCTDLVGATGDACGICDSGTLRCDRKEALICEGDREDSRNACGGCAVLDAEIGDACGACDSGALACADDNESLNCEGDLGDEARNACGGCGELENEPGESCMDGCGQYVCEEGALICDADEPPIWYQDNDDDEYGDPAAPTTQSCEQPENHVANADDCDDGVTDVNPGADEVADDRIDNDCDGLLSISGGTYSQGSPEEEIGHEDEEVQREVTLSRALSVGRTEVTRGDWSAHVPNTPAADGCDAEDCPVACVNAYEAMFYLNARSREEGLDACYTLSDCSGTPGTATCDEGTPEVCADNYRCSEVVFAGLDCTGYRLPTEAEFEFLARGGTRSGHYRGELTTAVGCTDNNLSDIAWWCGNGNNRSHEAAGQASNPFGLFDTLGNVEEWTGDGAQERLADTVTDPVVPFGDELVVRGGSFRDQTGRLRAAAVNVETAQCGSRFRGFRAVRSQVAE